MPEHTPSVADAAMDRHALGDDAAFVVVYDHVAPLIDRYARRHLRDSAAADDVTQHTLMSMHRARGDFAAGSAVLPWAYTIARRVIIDHLRQHSRETALIARARDSLIPSLAAPPDAQLAAREVVAALHAGLATLPTAQREVYRLVREQGLSLAEAARTLSTTIIAVKLRLHRAAVRLRASFAEPKAKSLPVSRRRSPR